MSEHYVTLFDAGFLPQGLALHQSLQRHAGDAQLWVLCLDRTCLDALQRLALPAVHLLDLEQLETPRLRQLRAERSRAEYCWTLTPWSIQWALEADLSIERVTYLDADLWFLDSPAPLLEELEAAGKSVLITRHAFSPQFDSSFDSGRYCVQFVTFVRDLSAPVLAWWRDQCLQSCSARAGAGVYGDQMYLDQFPLLFPGKVHVLAQEGLALAPWNAGRFPYGSAAFYHFHGVRLLADRSLLLGGVYTIPRPTGRAVYQPYQLALSHACRSLTALGCPIPIQVRGWPPLLKLGVLVSRFGFQLKRLADIFHVGLKPVC